MPGNTSRHLPSCIAYEHTSPPRRLDLHAMEQTDARSKYWCYTSFEEPIPADIKSCTYHVYGAEVCPETKKPHIQGYVEFRVRKRLTTLKGEYSEKIHWETRKGTSQQAADYCKKDGNFTEWGEISLSHQGKRNDIIKMKEALDEKKSLTAIADEEHIVSYARHYRFAEHYLNTHVFKPRNHNEKPRVVYIWGKPGSGKTSRVYDQHNRDEIFTYSFTKWFCGYTQQKVFLMDDLQPGWYRENRNFMLRILDRYPMRVEKKGSSIEFNSPIIYITSNYDIWTTFDCEPNDPILRRIDEIVHI